MNKVFSAKIKDSNREPSSPKRLDTEAKEVHMVPRIICSHLFFLFCGKMILQGALCQRTVASMPNVHSYLARCGGSPSHWSLVQPWPELYTNPGAAGLKDI